MYHNSWTVFDAQFVSLGLSLCRIQIINNDCTPLTFNNKWPCPQDMQNMNNINCTQKAFLPENMNKINCTQKAFLPENHQNVGKAKQYCLLSSRHLHIWNGVGVGANLKIISPHLDIAKGLHCDLPPFPAISSHSDHWPLNGPASSRK